ncbi:DUF4123 domain-containing protein [Bremerella sp.]|uniref:DUF4123 domain-containing protein n=1 Tax=Bremerella sp. TaxID=2795602 RepID=UPI00391A0595
MASPVDVGLLRQLLDFEIARHCGDSPLHAYAVLDAAQDPDLAMEIMRGKQLPMSSLFEGRAAPSMMTVAPYLIAFDTKDGLLDHWSHRWGTNLGIFVISDAAPRDILKHLRHIFVVQDESGQEYFFRFYDPRVIAPFIPTCEPKEFVEFFGPVTSFVVESGQSDVLVYRRQGKSERYGLKTSQSTA